VTFTVPTDSASQTIYIAPGIIVETGTAYFDALQLEEGPIANRYNLVENSDFKYGSSNWTMVNVESNDVITTTSNPEHPQNLDNNVLLLNGNANRDKRLIQEVKVSGKAGDVFVLGGWAKGDSVPYSYPRWFAVDLQFNYTDSSNYWYTYNFNEDSSDWQYVTNKAIAEKAYNSVTVIYRYYYNQNTAYFDGFQLFKEEFGQSYQYDDKGNLITTEDLVSSNSKFEYDTSTNDLIKAIDPNGGIFRYTYDGKHNIKTATTAESQVYSFNYDKFEFYTVQNNTTENWYYDIHTIDVDPYVMRNDGLHKFFKRLQIEQLNHKEPIQDNIKLIKDVSWMLKNIDIEPNDYVIIGRKEAFRKAVDDGTLKKLIGLNESVLKPLGLKITD
jgi:YD repeat-containing protein